MYENNSIGSLHTTSDVLCCGNVLRKSSRSVFFFSSGVCAATNEYENEYEFGFVLFFILSSVLQFLVILHFFLQTTTPREQQKKYFKCLLVSFECICALAALVVVGLFWFFFSQFKFECPMFYHGFQDKLIIIINNTYCAISLDCTYSILHTRTHTHMRTILLFSLFVFCFFTKHNWLLQVVLQFYKSGCLSSHFQRQSNCLYVFLFFTFQT